MSSRIPWIRFGAAIALAVVVAIILTAVLMRPPAKDLFQLGAIYVATASLSVLIGVAVKRWPWWRRLGRLGTSLTVGYGLAAVVTLLNVWIAARLMFLSQHDLALASALLIFASGISVAFGYLLSQGVTESLGRVAEASEKLSAGDFGARAEVRGQDEVARLAATFNAMAARLELTDQEKRRLENARRDFVAWVSHDLRTPLAALRAMVDALADGVVEDEATVAQYLARCLGEIERMNALIGDLFQLSRLDASQVKVEFQNCSLRDLISDAIGSMAAQAGQGSIELVGSTQEGLDQIYAAPAEISRVLHNLIQNALEHTPKGGKIAVQANREGDTILVTVEDSGSGVDPAESEKVFERFYRSDRGRVRTPGSGTGAGLGLAIAKSFVEAHHGRIWVEDAGLGGAKFSFTLPQVQRTPVESGRP